MKFGELNLATILSRIFLLSILFSNNLLAGIATGTGFFISQNGYFVTCFHVIDGAKVIAIRDSSGKTHQAFVVRTDINNDLALLKANGRFSSLPIANSGVAKRGAGVITVGFPHIDVQGAEPKVTDGIINSLTGIADDPRHFQISVPVQSGNSGGALVSMSGNIIGVVSSKLSALKMFKSTGDLPQNVNYAIKSNYLLELISTITGLKTHLKSPFLATKRELSDLTEQVEKATVLVLVDTEQNNSAVEAQPKSGSPPFASPNRQAGGTCNHNNDCDGNMMCMMGRCVVTAKTPAGGACWVSAECVGSLTCGSGKCAVPPPTQRRFGSVSLSKQEGESCNDKFECTGTLTCESGKCATLTP